MKALQRRTRVAAVIGVVAAAGAGTIIAVGTASAAPEPAKCTKNVNVREEPRIDARVVGLCRAGTSVKAGEIRNGFVQLADLGGWSAQQFISINGKRPVDPGPDGPDGRADGPDGPDGRDDATPSRNSRADEEATPGRSPSGGQEPGSTRSGDRSESHTNGEPDGPGADDAAAKPEPAPAPAPAKPGGGLPLPLLGG